MTVYHTEQFFLDLKVGDRVWIGDNYGEKNRIETISHRTRTQICIGNKDKSGRYFWTYRITLCTYVKEENNFAAWSGNARFISYKATPAECRDWDQKKRIEENQQKERERKEQQLKAKVAELRELLESDERTSNVYVEQAKWGSSEDRQGKFDVTINGLTESQVRQLAGKVRSETK